MTDAETPIEPGEPEKCQFVMEHLIALADQMNRLRTCLESQGIAVPHDLGRPGPCTIEAARWYTEEGKKQLNQMEREGLP